MILNTLYCTDNTKCYHMAYNILNALSDTASSDIEKSKDEFGNDTNFVKDRASGEVIFQSDNPLKIYDFLMGRVSALKSSNTINTKKTKNTK